MNNSKFFDYIEEHLNILATRINSRGRLNMLNLHNHSEIFYAHFLNELYGWKLGDSNAEKQNIEAIDLIDDTNKLVIQVSATNSKQKVESSLAKNLIKNYSHYTFKFVSISNDADNLRKETFNNPYNINFNPAIDIIDKNSLLATIRGLEIDDKRRIYDFIKNELGNDTNIILLDSNLATIINVLAKEIWDGSDKEYKYSPFEISRKMDYNNLKSTRAIIEEYKIHHHEIEKKYKEFDSLGSNKSYSVLQAITRYYIEESTKSESADIIFLNVSNRIMEKVQKSLNFVTTEFEILVLCIDILVVDAFIRCKIFENPENYNYATS